MSRLPKTELDLQERAAIFRERLFRSGYFLTALLIHIVVFFLVATWIVFKAPPQQVETSFQAVKIAQPIPPPPAPPQASGGEAKNPLDVNLTVTPPPAAISIAALNTPAAFSIDSVHLPQAPVPNLKPAASTGMVSSGTSGTGLGAGSVFGSGNSSGNGLSGYFYDFKQTPTHQPTGMDVDKEIAMLKKFFATGWNEEDLAKRFLKSPSPLVANQLLVPIQLSSEGPKAFGLEKICRPGYWAAIYHLKITAAKSGNFRIAGYGDDFLVVRVNGTNVLDSGYYPPVTSLSRKTVFLSNWLPRHPDGHPDFAQTVVGNSFRMDPGQELTIDVFLGDADDAGGQGACGYFLFLLEEGKDYGKDAQGNPLLPLLQVQPDSSVERKGKYPPFTVKPEDALLGL